MTSIMGPKCSFCGHRLSWHDPDGCKRTSDCRCAKFDDGALPGWFGIGWHQRMLRHRVEDLTTAVRDVNGREHRKYHARCSCGKEWT